MRLTHSHSGVGVAGDDSGRHGNNLLPGISYYTPPLSNPTHIQATKGRDSEREREREGGRERERERDGRRERKRERIIEKKSLFSKQCLNNYHNKLL